MKKSTWLRHRLVNFAHSIILLSAMGAILTGLGWLIAGPSGMTWALIAGSALMVVMNCGLSPRLILAMYGARPLSHHDTPVICTLIESLAARAGLRVTPKLYYVPSSVLNAFAVGTRNNCAIALSDGLIRSLSSRELAGVLAHEVSHIRNGDMWVMGLADLFSRLTSLFAWMGLMLLLINLPLLMLSGYQVAWLAIAMLLSTPTLTALLQLALSRTREFEADLGAAELTSDPRGLAGALAKLEHYQGYVMDRIFFPGRRVPEPSILRTHPPTEKRIKRLLALQSHDPYERVPARRTPEHPLHSHLPTRTLQPPRRHLNGLWY